MRACAPHCMRCSCALAAGQRRPGCTIGPGAGLPPTQPRCPSSPKPSCPAAGRTQGCQPVRKPGRYRWQCGDGGENQRQPAGCHAQGTCPCLVGTSAAAAPAVDGRRATGADRLGRAAAAAPQNGLQPGVEPMSWVSACRGGSDALLPVQSQGRLHEIVGIVGVHQRPGGGCRPHILPLSHPAL